MNYSREAAADAVVKVEGSDREASSEAEVEGKDEDGEKERRRQAAELEAGQHSELFCALCTKRRHLLRPLMLAYAQVFASNGAVPFMIEVCCAFGPPRNVLSSPFCGHPGRLELDPGMNSSDAASVAPVHASADLQAGCLACWMSSSGMRQHQFQGLHL